MVTPHDVAQLISEHNIVALFQGRSEGGPRALGNRSLLYDPRDPNAKDHVNTVKNREWYRPFAGTVLKECAHDLFDMAGLDESPFMTYAVEAKIDAWDIIPGILHLDKTCRIQTVTQEQNYHYYNLIKAFDDITRVPVLFNTSFNLAGETIVETLDDAIDTLERSSINYMYLPESSELICIS